MGAPVDVMSDVSSWIATIILGVGTGLFGLHQYKKAPKEPTPEKDVQVVSAALFSDRKVLMDFTMAIERVCERLDETNSLLREDAQRRHDEKIIREALRERGIIEKG